MSEEMKDPDVSINPETHAPMPTAQDFMNMMQHLSDMAVAIAALQAQQESKSDPTLSSPPNSEVTKEKEKEKKKEKEKDWNNVFCCEIEIQ